MPGPFIAPLKFGWFMLAWCLAPTLSLRLCLVTPLVTPPSFGWFVPLPRASAYHADVCCVASHHTAASCASTPLIRESIRRRLPPLLPLHLSSTMSPSPEQKRGLPKHCHFCCPCGARSLPERGLPHHCRCHGCPCFCSSPARGPSCHCRHHMRPSQGCGLEEGASLSG